jgi:hypothetical protein
VDESIDTGQINELEIALLQRSPLWPQVAGWVLSQLRERVASTLEVLVDRASLTEQQAVLAHLMAPHPPFLHGGEPDCYAQGSCSLFDVRESALGMTDTEYATAFVHQLDSTNAQVLDALDRMILTDPGAIMIVLGDHGARHDEHRADEWRRALLSVRGSHALDADHSSRDLFQRLLDGMSPGSQDGPHRASLAPLAAGHPAFRRPTEDAEPTSETLLLGP